MSKTEDLVIETENALRDISEDFYYSVAEADSQENNFKDKGATLRSIYIGLETYPSSDESSKAVIKRTKKTSAWKDFKRICKKHNFKDIYLGARENEISLASEKEIEITVRLNKPKI